MSPRAAIAGSFLLPVLVDQVFSAKVKDTDAVNGSIVFVLVDVDVRDSLFRVDGNGLLSDIFCACVLSDRLDSACESELDLCESV